MDTCALYIKRNKTLSTPLVGTITSHTKNTMLAEWNHTTTPAS